MTLRNSTQQEGTVILKIKVLEYIALKYIRNRNSIIGHANHTQDFCILLSHLMQTLDCLFPSIRRVVTLSMYRITLQTPAAASTGPGAIQEVHMDDKDQVLEPPSVASQVLT